MFFLEIGLRRKMSGAPSPYGPPYGSYYPPPPPHYPPEHHHHHHPPPPGHYPPPPPGHYPPPPHHGHYPPPGGHYPPPGGTPPYAYLPVPVIPYAVPYPEPATPQPQPSAPEITAPDVQLAIAAAEPDISWVPSTSTTARILSGKAFVGGHEGWDGSQLWVIRARHNGDLVPGKLAVRHNAAYIPHGGNEIPVQNIEVLCCKPKDVHWVPTSGGVVPYGAIPGGQTANGETLYIGRAQYQLSLTPGKIHPSHGCLYISFSGSEISQKTYDILCRVNSNPLLR